MSFDKGWEDFYTDSRNDEDLVDYININTKKKQYILYNDVDDLVTDGYDMDDNYDSAMEVSREIFDIIVAGVKEKRYTRLVPEIDIDDEDDDYE